MKTQLAITDLTRMQRGCVCVAGYDKAGRCIRPVLGPPGIQEASLFANARPSLFPFAVVEFALGEPRPQPPHTEDQLFDPAAVKFVRWVKAEKREQLLGLSLFKDVASIFEQPICADRGYSVADGVGPRSIGTIRPLDVAEVKYELDRTGKWDYRLRFVDGAGDIYRLKITDLTWHYYCRSLVNETRGPGQIARALTDLLQNRKVYLRIGLARGWAAHPGQCYLQVNAIHTFPDYLEGKTFADFRATG